MTFPTCDPTQGLQLNAEKTDIELIWFAEGTTREWARAVINAALWQFLGQWIYDRRQGVDYLNEVFVNNPDTEVLANLFRLTLISIPQVQAVESATVRFDSAAKDLYVDWAVVVGGELVQGKTGLSPQLYPFVFGQPFGPFFG